MFSSYLADGCFVAIGVHANTHESDEHKSLVARNFVIFLKAFFSLSSFIRT